MVANPLLFIAVTLTLGVILVNGWTDVPNAIATCVVTRCMPQIIGAASMAFMHGAQPVQQWAARKSLNP